ncbi:YCF48-related protein [Hydrogenophaga sp.]|uniref:WD40/YVTN/BNR-like repeat-containing protein n=1 Tax=Hydrogenophaga sp. TaxID=1904254 RepID=UPI0025BB2F9D|nr:YCF48-related protein [Hydrogenophaga sp.]MBT9462848.1 glycosyl hydrolase [Hydrogenophaga sp.]
MAPPRSAFGVSRRAALVGLAGTAVSGLLPLDASAAPAPAVLSRPALMSPKALGAAMLAVTRAGNRLVAVGERGTVLLSDDNGQHWRQAAVPVQVTLTCVSFADERHGWAAGHLGTILHSDDGGLSWRKQLDGIAAAARVAEAARASGDTKALAEAQALVDEGPDKPFFDLSFIDTRRGFAAGAYGLLFATVDGGQTWQARSARAANPQGLHLYGLRATASQLVVAGEQGLLMRSVDGGATFSALPSPYKGSFLGLLQTPGGQLIAHGLRGSAYRADPDASRWERLDSQTTATLSASAVLPNGGFVLVSQVGEVWVAPPDAFTLRRLPVREAVPIAGAVLAADGALVLASLRGMRRLASLPIE